MRSLEEIRRILREVQKEARERYRAEILGIFGSFARGEQREGSDVDILVRFLPGATLLDLVGLGEFLEERLKVKVDIVSERALREEIKGRVLREIIWL